MSTKDRHSDVKKAEFFRQIFKKEHSFQNNINSNIMNSPPRTKPFVFNQTYSQTSQCNLRDPVMPSSNYEKSSEMPSPSPIKTRGTSAFTDAGPAPGFSSFNFKSSLTSELLGDHVDHVSRKNKNCL